MTSQLKIFLGKRSIKIFLVVLVVVVVVFLVRVNSTQSQLIHVVGEHQVEQVVLLSGSVRAVGQVDLSFDAIGKVATTAVSQGAVVTQGQVLAELDYKVLEADLLQAVGRVQSAQSSVSLARASVQKAEANLALVRAQNRGSDSTLETAEKKLANAITEQATTVKNAYLDLLNNDLTAYPVDNYRNVTPPIVSGNYAGELTGEYRLNFYNSGGQTGYSARASGLSGATVSFANYGVPAPLDVHGLYLTLPASAEGESYGSTNWVIPVPNIRSTTYQAKLGAYNKALQTQSVAIANAEANLANLVALQANGGDIAVTTAQEQQAIAMLQEAKANLSQAQGSLTQAQAGVDKVQAQIDGHIIRAPFSGTIARFDLKVGQLVGSGQSGITIVTDGDYELKMSVPEIDVAKVRVGQKAEIILDAYGTEVVWSGVLSEVELVETKIDGVPSYSSIVTITNPDERIKIGMNARARIAVETKAGVLAIPSSYVVTKNNTKTVLVKVNNRKTQERVIKTGLVGTDRFIEVTNGLKIGESIIAPSGQ